MWPSHRHYIHAVLHIQVKCGHSEMSWSEACMSWSEGCVHVICACHGVRGVYMCMSWNEGCVHVICAVLGTGPLL